jgi:glycosyltransferase involved in cell wall biosynthesis
MEDMGGRLFEDPSMFYVINTLSHISRLKKLINQHNIDVIISANIMPSFSASVVNGEVPIVFDYLDHFEESAAIYYPENIFGTSVKKVVAGIVRSNLKHARMITTVTDEFSEYLSSKGLSDIVVVPNGVDTSVVKPISTAKAKEALGVSNNLVLGYVGSMEHWLDLETVISALPILIKKIPEIKLIIVGPSLFTDYSNKLKTLASKLGVTDRIIFSGGVDHSEIFRYISAMDICLNPRKPLDMNNMTIGGKVFNYLACGKPVLSSNMKPLEKLFSGKDGLFYYDTKEEFIELVQTVNSAKHDSKHYRKVARKYDWDVIADQYEKVLEDLASRQA